MKWSRAFIPTLREDPSDAEAISHRLMVRAGLIRRLGSGTYSYLPLGLKVLQRVEAIVRQEMNRAGALELLLPAIQPAEIWAKTGRLNVLREILITYKDRQGKVNVFGPTHEEVITDLASKEIRSYRDLPAAFYQIQTKFRDEPRPRFGVLRSKEFIMKDAYSFDADGKGLEASYAKMCGAYCRIFERCGLNFITAEADPGFMGGGASHEFMAPADCGEDEVALCKACGYAASLEKAECKASPKPGASLPGHRPAREIETPGVSSVEDVAGFLKVKPASLVKTLIYLADTEPAAVLLRGDYELNEGKLKRLLGCDELVMAGEEVIERLTGGPPGFSGPVALKGIKIIADFSIEGMSNFITGANKKDTHLMNVNADVDFAVDKWGDLRYITENDPCPKCNKKMALKRAIELGHIFKLGTKYSKPLGAGYLDEKGKRRDAVMGCYGIGINRIVASVIEQNNDKDGIIWPVSIAPYQVVIIEIDPGDNDIKREAEALYEELGRLSIEALLDDRAERPGIKFKDADLIGLPVQVIIGKKALAAGKIELKIRKGQRRSLHLPKEIAGIIKDELACSRSRPESCAEKY